MSEDCKNIANDYRVKLFHRVEPDDSLGRYGDSLLFMQDSCEGSSSHSVLRIVH